MSKGARTKERIAIGLLVFVSLIGLFLFFVPTLDRARTAVPRDVDLEAPTEAAPPPEPKKKTVLKSTLAGSWYPADQDELKDDIDRYLANVTVAVPEKVHALILPHAGYRYSGQTAAYGLRAVAAKKFARVLVMGPSHRVSMQNMASVPDATHYATPLGEVPLDLPFIAELRRHSYFQNLPQAHRGEHSVQIEIPLLQRVLGDFQLVPIVVGQLDLETARAMAEVLLGLIDDKTLVIASSDFTHYGPNYGFIPFKEDVEDNIKQLDMGAFETINQKSAEGFYRYFTKTEATICGRFPITVLLAMLSPDWEAHRLHYTTSGRITGDFSNSVSYLTVAFTGSWPKRALAVSDEAEMALSEEDKRDLLKLARGTLTAFLTDSKVPAPETLGIEIKPCMKLRRASFVTLNKHGQLRGCIGEIFPSRPLHESVQSNALNAGLRDRRFAQVTLAELPELEFEISMLTPPRPVDSYEDIVIGTHGVVLEKSGRRAVFLPQVAPEQGWSLEETLSHLSVKAGLPEDAWKEGASFTVFEAVVFGEKEE